MTFGLLKAEFSYVESCQCCLAGMYIFTTHSAYSRSAYDKLILLIRTTDFPVSLPQIQYLTALKCQSEVSVNSTLPQVR